MVVVLEQVAARDVGRVDRARGVLEAAAVGVEAPGDGRVVPGGVAFVGLVVRVIEVGDGHAVARDLGLLGDEVAAAVLAVVVEVGRCRGRGVRDAHRAGQGQAHGVAQQGGVGGVGQQDPGLRRFVGTREVGLLAELDLVRLLGRVHPGGVAATLYLREVAVVDDRAVRSEHGDGAGVFDRVVHAGVHVRAAVVALDEHRAHARGPLEVHGAGGGAGVVAHVDERGVAELSARGGGRGQRTQVDGAAGERGLRAVGRAGDAGRDVPGAVVALHAEHERVVACLRGQEQIARIAHALLVHHVATLAHHREKRGGQGGGRGEGSGGDGDGREQAAQDGLVHGIPLTSAVEHS